MRRIKKRHSVLLVFVITAVVCAQDAKDTIRGPLLHNERACNINMQPSISWLSNSQSGLSFRLGLTFNSFEIALRISKTGKGQGLFSSGPRETTKNVASLAGVKYLNERYYVSLSSGLSYVNGIRSKFIDYDYGSFFGPETNYEENRYGNFSMPINFIAVVKFKYIGTGIDLFINIDKHSYFSISVPVFIGTLQHGQ
jgi:hypothetical protein